jgi:DNA-directed RNA polymerase subunit RPC12/RpoP
MIYGFEPYGFAFIPRRCSQCGRIIWLEEWDGDSVTYRCRECVAKLLEKYREHRDNLLKNEERILKWQKEKREKEERKKIYRGVAF